MTVPKISSCFILNNPPIADVNFDYSSENSTFKLVEKPLRSLNKDEILIKTLYLSNDPTQRAWIQKGLNADRMYVDPVLQGEVMRSVGLGQVINTNSKDLKDGDLVLCELTWSDFCIIPISKVMSKLTDRNVPLTMYLDVLGITGLTAYFGLVKVAQLKSTDTIVISAAAGATGSMCVQIAKNVIGCKKVIGISGGADKCKFVESIGADKCVDYKNKNFGRLIEEALGEEKYCDVFFDGVGGKILDRILTLIKPFGKVIACGAIAGYNDSRRSMIANWPQIITNRLSVQGFIVLDYREQYDEGIKNIVQWIKEGKIKVNESSFTLIDLSANKFSRIPDTWGILFSNEKGPGKLLTKVSDYKL